MGWLDSGKRAVLRYLRCNEGPIPPNQYLRPSPHLPRFDVCAFAPRHGSLSDAVVSHVETDCDEVRLFQNDLMRPIAWKSISLLAVVLLAPFLSMGAEAGTRGFQNRVFVDAQGAKHPFVVFIPAAYQPGQHPPVMLFLHGSGERGANNIDQMMAGIGPALWKRKTKFPFVVVLPQCRADSNWLVDGADAQRALAMLRQVQAEFTTDPDRVILTGLSMGGSGTWSIAARDPSAWSAIVPMCGRPDLTSAAKFAAARLPVWNFCGDKDRPETVKANRDMAEALRQAGANATYTEYPDVGHNCWDKAYGTEELYAWMLEQSRRKNAEKRS